MRIMRHAAPLSTVAIVALLAACGSAGDPDETTDAVALDYWLWDDRQLPAYQQCVDAFEESHEGITITITQTGWNDYWTGLNTGLASGTAPDVFVDQLSYYPEFVTNDQLLDIEPFVTESGLDLGIYEAGLAEAWTKDGGRYGLPKDFNTIGIVYNADMLTAAGLDPAEVNDLTWDPETGGTFTELLARLTVDANGVRGDEAGFDKSNVAVYGSAAPDLGNHYGQQDWGNLAASTGAVLLDPNPFGTTYAYDDPGVIATLQWYRDMIEAGYMMSPDQVGGLGNKALFESETVALATQGDWNVADLSTAAVPLAWAQLPAGPKGITTNFNGVADSIYAQTDHPDEAWEWVQFLGSSDCQSLVAEAAVNFPAITTDAGAAFEAFEAAGTDLSALEGQLESAQKWSIPISDNASEISQIVVPVITNVLLGGVSAQDGLTTANEQVNALFE